MSLKQSNFMGQNKDFREIDILFSRGHSVSEKGSILKGHYLLPLGANSVLLE